MSNIHCHSTAAAYVPSFGITSVGKTISSGNNNSHATPSLSTTAEPSMTPKTTTSTLLPSLQSYPLLDEKATPYVPRHYHHLQSQPQQREAASTTAATTTGSSQAAIASLSPALSGSLSTTTLPTLGSLLGSPSYTPSYTPSAATLEKIKKKTTPLLRPEQSPKVGGDNTTTTTTTTTSSTSSCVARNEKQQQQQCGVWLLPREDITFLFSALSWNVDLLLILLARAQSPLAFSGEASSSQQQQQQQNRAGDKEEEEEHKAAVFASAASALASRTAAMSRNDTPRSWIDVVTYERGYVAPSSSTVAGGTAMVFMPSISLGASNARVSMMAMRGDTRACHASTAYTSSDDDEQQQQQQRQQHLGGAGGASSSTGSPFLYDRMKFPSLAEAQQYWLEAGRAGRRRRGNRTFFVCSTPLPQALEMGPIQQQERYNTEGKIFDTDCGSHAEYNCGDNDEEEEENGDESDVDADSNSSSSSSNSNSSRSSLSEEEDEAEADQPALRPRTSNDTNKAGGSVKHSGGGACKGVEAAKKSAMAMKKPGKDKKEDARPTISGESSSWVLTPLSPSSSVSVSPVPQDASPSTAVGSPLSAKNFSRGLLRGGATSSGTVGNANTTLLTLKQQRKGCRRRHHHHRRHLRSSSLASIRSIASIMSVASTTCGDANATTRASPERGSLIGITLSTPSSPLAVGVKRGILSCNNSSSSSFCGVAGAAGVGSTIINSSSSGGGGGGGGGGSSMRRKKGARQRASRAGRRVVRVYVSSVTQGPRAHLLYSAASVTAIAPGGANQSSPTPMAMQAMKKTSSGAGGAPSGIGGTVRIPATTAIPSAAAAAAFSAVHSNKSGVSYATVVRAATQRQQRQTLASTSSPSSLSSRYALHIGTSMDHDDDGASQIGFDEVEDEEPLFRMSRFSRLHARGQFTHSSKATQYYYGAPVRATIPAVTAAAAASSSIQNSGKRYMDALCGCNSGSTTTTATRTNNNISVQVEAQAGAAIASTQAQQQEGKGTMSVTAASTLHKSPAQTGQKRQSQLASITGGYHGNSYEGEGTMDGVKRGVLHNTMRGKPSAAAAAADTVPKPSVSPSPPLQQQRQTESSAVISSPADMYRRSIPFFIKSFIRAALVVIAAQVRLRTSSNSVAPCSLPRTQQQQQIYRESNSMMNSGNSKNNNPAVSAGMSGTTTGAAATSLSPIESRALAYVRAYFKPFREMISTYVMRSEKEVARRSAQAIFVPSIISTATTTTTTTEVVNERDAMFDTDHLRRVLSVSNVTSLYAAAAPLWKSGSPDSPNVSIGKRSSAGTTTTAAAVAAAGGGGATTTTTRNYEERQKQNNKKKGNKKGSKCGLDEPASHLSSSSQQGTGEVEDVDEEAAATPSLTITKAAAVVVGAVSDEIDEPQDLPEGCEDVEPLVTEQLYLSGKDAAWQPLLLEVLGVTRILQCYPESSSSANPPSSIAPNTNNISSGQDTTTPHHHTLLASLKKFVVSTYMSSAATAHASAASGSGGTAAAVEDGSMDDDEHDFLAYLKPLLGLSTSSSSPSPSLLKEHVQTAAAAAAAAASAAVGSTVTNTRSMMRHSHSAPALGPHHFLYYTQKQRQVGVTSVSSGGGGGLLDPLQWHPYAYFPDPYVNDIININNNSSSNHHHNVGNGQDNSMLLCVAALPLSGKLVYKWVIPAEDTDRYNLSVFFQSSLFSFLQGGQLPAPTIHDGGLFVERYYQHLQQQQQLLYLSMGELPYDIAATHLSWSPVQQQQQQQLCAAMGPGESTLVHCSAGMHRSCGMVIAFMLWVRYQCRVMNRFLSCRRRRRGRRNYCLAKARQKHEEEEEGKDGAVSSGDGSAATINTPSLRTSPPLYTRQDATSDLHECIRHVKAQREIAEPIATVTYLLDHFAQELIE